MLLTEVTLLISLQLFGLEGPAAGQGSAHLSEAVTC